ncbi:MAG: hypothetical protein JZU65_06225 [Chlorobium sp.]|nr:hypothetical protein [Chlorobium sp.]
MKLTADKQHSFLLKRFHILCTKAGMQLYEKQAMVGSYGHESSRDMTNAELMQACTVLERAIEPELVKMEIWRKRVIGSVGGWMRLVGRGNNIDMIKAISCRASGFDDFNKIPIDRLVNIYNTFLKKQKDWKNIGELVTEELTTLTHLN